MENKIKFGTDGWRAIIAEDFTIKNVEKVTHALATHLLKNTNSQNKIVIGYDTRFMSKRFAKCAADILKKRGFNVILSEGYASTPSVSVNVVKLKADAGIVISASHNPPDFNGYKIKTAEGCSSPENVTKDIERLITSDVEYKEESGGNIKIENIMDTYFTKLISFIDFDIIKKSGLKIVADPMYGAACGCLEKLLAKTNCKVTSIHNKPDPNFGGLHPEPIESELVDLKSQVKHLNADAGLATDGDADRIGIVDENGKYYTPHQVFPLLLYYLAKYKKLQGKVVQSLSLGYVSERIAKDLNLPFEEVPIGFKYIAEKIISEKVLIGGEESGGYGYGGFLPERDGILNSLMFIEMLAFTKKPLSVLLKEIEKLYGVSVYQRTDTKKPDNAKWTKEEFVSSLKTSSPSKIAGKKVKCIKDYDGIEFVLEDDSWLLLRPSGTEPIIRVYSESSKIDQTKSLIAWGNKTISKFAV